MNFDERIITDASPSTAFLYLSDLRNVPSWDPNISQVEQLTPGPVGVGSRFRVTMRLLGIRTSLDYHVEVYEPERRVIFLGRSLAAKVSDTITLMPFRGGSRIHWTADIRLFAPLSLADPLLSMLFRPTITRALATLKQTLNRLTPHREPRVTPAWRRTPSEHHHAQAS